MDSTTQIADEAAAAPGDGAVQAADLAGLVDIEPTAADAEQVAAQPEAEVPSIEVEPPAVEPEVEASAPAEISEDVFNPLTSVLGDIEELETDKFYDNITEDDIKELPTVARRMLHNFRLAYEIEKSKLGHSTNASETKLAERELELQKMERDFARRQAEFSALANDPKVQEVLNTPEGELPDILSEEGIQARIQKGIAEGMRNVLSPMQQASAQHAKQTAYLEFLESHPELKQPSFKNEVSALVQGRRGTDAPISTEDAYQIVKARRVLAEQNARIESERRARAQSARRVSKQSMSSAPGVEDIPVNVKKRGAHAIANWLQSNPEAAKRIAGEVR
tara:strand:- start:1728 stop:2735 length:1008 start_codon:yes stop_codon:yes gene_type:complete